jgi:hypothetical protein
MRDDRVQGILFSSDPRVDLVQRRRHERVLRKMLVGKHHMQGWLTRPRSLSPVVPETSKQFIVVRGGKKRHADLYRLTKRFKDIDY